MHVTLRICMLPISAVFRVFIENFPATKFRAYRHFFQIVRDQPFDTLSCFVSSTRVPCTIQSPVKMDSVGCGLFIAVSMQWLRGSCVHLRPVY
jgi:hypothetical protein